MEAGWKKGNEGQGGDLVWRPPVSTLPDGPRRMLLKSVLYHATCKIYFDSKNYNSFTSFYKLLLNYMLYTIALLLIIVIESMLKDVCRQIPLCDWLVATSILIVESHKLYIIL